jgi:hypothetical protein
MVRTIAAGAKVEKVHAFLCQQQHSGGQRLPFALAVPYLSLLRTSVRTR